jgi:tellurite resistance protein
MTLDTGWQQATDYAIDRWQRCILFWDIMRQRGNDYFANLRAGLPPALAFEYETILEARDFDPPVNYTLVKILESRTVARDRRHRDRDNDSRRQTAPGTDRQPGTKAARPVVIIDPRAGHGPGIGGSKLNSQIGVALDYGYPVYFIMFSPDPVPGQTIAAVQQAEIRFLEEVARRHPDAPEPSVIGNCQAGWAAALIGADRPDVVGPMVFTGSPLSYWGGVEGANPMRYKGGLNGGVWLTSLWSDLGHGQFDGAHLVAGFEDLNPANTYWTKQYNLFAKVDTEARRYLNFEKWWGGFFKLDTNEIHFITDSLFVGNELEKGLVQLQEGRPINLKNFKDPIFVFASSGDNITPPQQALNWIVKVYGSVEEIRRNGQIIVYMVHESIGHLGIFVSGKVAGKEHRQIIGSLDMMEFLVPGLYEMVIVGQATNPDIEDYTVRFEERDIDDILAMDDGLEDEAAFVPVDAVSKANDALYRQWIRPWVRAFTTPWTAEALRQLHPLRMQRTMCSDANPLLWPLDFWSSLVKENRRAVAADNPFAALETDFSENMKVALNLYRDIRDSTQEWLFKAIYNNPWTTFWWGSGEPAQADEDSQDREVAALQRRREVAFARRHIHQGGFAEAIIRIIVAVVNAEASLDKRQYQAAENVIRRHKQFYESPAEVKKILQTQARVLGADTKKALEGLSVLLPSQEQRKEAFEVAMQIALADLRVGVSERAVLDRIRTILDL